MRTGSGPARRIVQLHPTLRCNLRCVHCYSSSGPELAGALDPGVVCAALDDARALGHEVLSVSGGEPLLWPALPEVLAHARGLGMTTAVATNGTLVRTRRFAAVAAHASGFAVSVDGPPELHDAIRASPSAWRRTAAGVAALRERGIPFAVIHTLTRASWPHLPWLARWAAEQGATALQVHPLEHTGRAAHGIAAGAPGPAERARAYLLCAALAEELEGRLRIHLDLLPRRALLRDPELVYAGAGTCSEVPADRLGVLVVEPDGVVSPVAFGFGRAHALGALHDAPLRDLWARWAAEREPAFRALCREVLDELAADDAEPLVSWTEVVTARSRGAALAPAA